MALQFRYRRSDLYIASHRLNNGIDSTDWFAPLELVEDGTLASLRRAFLAAAKDYGLSSAAPNQWGLPGLTAFLRVARVPAAEFSEDYSIAEPLYIGLSGNTLILDVQVATHGSNLNEEDYEPLLRPLLRRARARFLAAATDGERTQVYVDIRIELQLRGATVRDAVYLADDIGDLLVRIRDRGLTADTAFSLVRANRADLIVGLPESSWLDVKSQGYDLTEDRGRIELAQDVARFANGDEASLLLIGFTTKKRSGTEIIASVHPVERVYDAARYHRAIDSKVFPPVQGLVVTDVPTRTRDGRTGHLLAILVPKQPEESKPVLVHGAIVAGKVEGAFISIVQRRGEDSVPVRPEAIHATLAAGRALLRHGEIPTRTSIDDN